MSERKLNALFNLVFRVDRSGQRDSLRSMRQLDEATEEIRDGLKKVENSAQEAGAALDNIDRSEGILRINQQFEESIRNGRTFAGALEVAGRRLDQIGATRADIDRLAGSLGLTAQQAGKLNQALSVTARNDAFDAISRQVGLAGDFQSNLGAARGLAGIAGATSVASGLDIVGEVVVLAEELPRLKTAISGLPEVAKAAVTALGVGGVGLIAGIAALALAFNELSKQTKEQKERTLAQIDAQRTYIELLRTGTTTEIEEGIANLRQQLDVARTLRTSLQRQLEDVEDDRGIFEDLGDKIGVAGGNADALREDIKELDKEITKARAELGAYNNALDSYSVATRDAAEAEKELQEAREEALKATTEQRFSAQRRGFDFAQDALELARAGDIGGVRDLQDQLQSRLKVEEDYKRWLDRAQDLDDDLRTAELDRATQQIDELKTFLFILDNDFFGALQQAEENAVKLEAFNTTLQNFGSRVTTLIDAFAGPTVEDRISQLNEQVQAEIALVNFQRTATIPTINSRIEALQTERNALESIVPELVELAKSSEAGATALAQTRSQLEGIDTQLAQLADIGKNAIADATADLASDLAQIASERDAAIAKIQTDAVNKQRELLRDLNDKLNELSSETTEKRLDAQREFNKESSDIEEDLAKERLQIERRAQRSITQAIGDRDALAAFQAKQQREEQLTDAEEAAEEQREELQENYREQLRIIETELRKQQQTLQAQYNAQLRDLQIATQNAVLQEQNKASQEIQIRQQAYQNEIDDLARHMVDYNNILANGLNSALSTVITWVNGINQAVGGLQLSSSSATLLSGLGGSGAQSFSPSQQQQITSIFDNQFSSYLQVAAGF